MDNSSNDTDISYIDNYFNGKLSATEKEAFEGRCETDPDFAKDVAFYITTMDNLKEELVEQKRMEFAGLYTELSLKKTPSRGKVRKIVYYVSIAAVFLLLFVGVKFLFKPQSVQQLADNYIEQSWKTLDVTMGREDEMEKGMALYNQGKLKEALQQFQSVIAADTSDYVAKKYAGIAALRLKDCHQAEEYFKQLENYTLKTNPGKFFHALALIKCNGDMQQAKQLLQQVSSEGLEGKEFADKWLEKW